MNFWLAKTEPETFSWQNMLDEKETTWDGVRNYAARNNLRAMKKGDLVLIYHSVSDKCAIGIATVSKENFQDPTDASGTWSAVCMRAKITLPNTVSLANIKSNELLQQMWLVKNSRLSVQPVTQHEFETILQMSGMDTAAIEQLYHGK